ncbi:MAG: N-acetyltransferase [Bacteroidia bacterium]|nr:GNAT family N-acetyltransferase [Bacteroidales bacterium]NCD40929.1 N-acetyltransferase [Bacteroidia bacterium]MDD3010841.1 GNAT family N-acetyltransferase [Bacteroidales bacterium]MDD3960451.1 GNAT family N-acetyltransferase [Bacteroidales bacterium]MDY0287039.1 GNAT family N-acetyltransferase [Bacteroidales bacterium]
MLEIKVIRSVNDFKEITQEQFIEFLFKHLERFGDPREHISNCLEYALSADPGKGGFALAAFYEGIFVGALIMNKTGMRGYIPENILVYIAVDSNYRGKGIGNQIIQKAVSLTEGDIKLHVEYDNPAKHLYERVGFTNKYAEMRLSNPKTK